MHPILEELSEQLLHHYPTASRTPQLYPLYNTQYQKRYKPFWKLYNYDYVLEFDRNRARQINTHRKMMIDLLGFTDDATFKVTVLTVLKPSPPSLNCFDHKDDKKLCRLCEAFKPWFDARPYIGIIEVLLSRGEAVSTVIAHAKQLYDEGWGDDL